MGRPNREHEPGSWVHAVAVGNNKCDIYLRDANRRGFLAMLERLCMRSDSLLLAYCLMATHVHMVFRVGDEPLARTLQVLLGGYSRMFNLEYGRTGHLFRNRYFAVIAKTDSHAREVCRYVALNPVRAGVCDRPEDWPWSSYASTIGVAAPIPFVAADALLALFDRDTARARAAFREFVQDGLGRPVSAELYPRGAVVHRL